ncbi:MULTISPECIES: trigger factor [unclassified Clostridium]|uniref:trigger factor n=1 Tax=unclassified Clostridium TaxID=2614128 RepID=UPI000E532998|nr:MULTISPECIES: trigger factor [unclassified Clostridium]RHP49207.1 trigger factor [Clostridium sp. AF32-12BH]RHV63476.1 trigger factor [Clostridium sp. OM02-18AC]
MSLQVEKLEKNMAKLTVEVPAEQFEAALKTSYNKNKNKFNIPGFRKGKAPQAMIEKMYGVGVFYEDAVDEAINASYPDAAKESGLEIVSRPEISIEQVEKGKAFIYVATVATKPEVTLGEYKGIEVEKAKPEVTDADVEAELKKVQEQNSRLVTVEDRAVADGDQTVIDFEGFVDGKAFEGGKAEDYTLVIGSHSFIDTFEDQLIGKNIGEDVEVNVTFPAEYHAAELAGKPATFKVKIKEIKMKELPELNDEFASEVSEFETLDAYKEDVKNKLAETKQAQATAENENNVVQKVVDNAQMDIPAPMVDEQVRNMIEDYARRLQSQGISFDQYLQFTGSTIEQLQEQMRPQAELRLRTRLVLEAVVAAEKIEPSDELVEAEIKKMSENYKMDVEQIKNIMGEAGMAQMKADMAVQEAVDFLVAEAKLV